MTILFALLLVTIAAALTAVMDTIAFHGGGALRKYGDFFNIKKQGKMLPLTKFPFDGFHVAKFLSVLAYSMAICLQLHGWYFIMGIAVVGSLFNIIFNLFWNKILEP